MNKDEQVSRNIELAGRFFEDLLEHPSKLISRPDSEYVILIPEGDKELAAANLKTAGVLIQKCPQCGAPMKPRTGETPREAPEDEGTGRILLQAVCP
jgi:hypothetical protein